MQGVWQLCHRAAVLLLEVDLSSPHKAPWSKLWPAGSNELGSASLGYPSVLDAVHTCKDVTWPTAFIIYVKDKQLMTASRAAEHKVVVRQL